MVRSLALIFVAAVLGLIGVIAYFSFQHRSLAPSRIYVLKTEGR